MNAVASQPAVLPTVCRWLLFFSVLFVGVCLQPLPATAQDVEVQIPGQLTQLGAGQVRFPAAIASASATRAPRAPGQNVQIPFLPIIDPTSYAESKAALSASHGPSGRGAAAAPSGALAPPTDTGFGFDSTNQTQACCYPPDTIAAEGAGEIVTATNDLVQVYDTGGGFLKSFSLGGLFNVSEFIFDPQVRFDPEWQRWVFLATRRSISSTEANNGHFWLAISQTADAGGGYIVYYFPIVEGPGNWCDFDHLGMDQDALIFTCNIFHRNADNTDSFVHGWVGVIGKARTYNGLTAFFNFFTPAGGNIAPPIVSPDAFSQANGNTYLLSAPPAGSALTEYRLTNTSRPIDTTFTMMSTASVGAYMFPPNAPQPGTPALLDTSDARIVDTVFQVDASPATLFAVHSINFSGFATPRYYEINAVTGGVVQEGLFFASGTSSGWNASIATNSTKNAFFPSRDVYVNWSSTDANNGANLSERISGRCHGDPPGVISNDADVADSLSFYLLGRTGDYSSVSVDPDDGTAIVYNETFLDPSTWNTHVEKISFPVACP